MEGVSNEDNEIYLEVHPDLLLRSLKTAHSAKWVKVKLTKKHVPCLTIEIDLVSTLSCLLSVIITFSCVICVRLQNNYNLIYIDLKIIII